MFEKMYYHLFAQTAKALETLPYEPGTAQCRWILEKAMSDTEEMYISAEDEKNRPLTNRI